MLFWQMWCHKTLRYLFQKIFSFWLGAAIQFKCSQLSSRFFISIQLRQFTSAFLLCFFCRDIGLMNLLNIACKLFTFYELPFRCCSFSCSSQWCCYEYIFVRFYSYSLSALLLYTGMCCVLFGV
jgi:hypothetical protein